MIKKITDNRYYINFPFSYKLFVTIQRRQFVYQGRFYKIPILQLLNKQKAESLITFLSW